MNQSYFNKKNTHKPTSTPSTFNGLEQVTIFSLSFAGGMLFRLCTKQLDMNSMQLPYYISGVIGLIASSPKWSFGKYSEAITEGVAGSTGYFTGYVTTDALLQYVR
jgi:hypothetical protein